MVSMLDNQGGSRDAIGLACKYLGRFLYEFAQMEIALNEAISKLFDLSPDNARIVSENIEIGRKVDIVHSIVLAQSGSNGKDLTKKAASVFNALRGINDPDRIMITHSLFSLHGTGAVRFEKHRARTGLIRNEVIWRFEQFDRKCVEMQQITSDLREMTATLRPYLVPLDRGLVLRSCAQRVGVGGVDTGARVSERTDPPRPGP
jgi:hypothetical protein